MSKPQENEAQRLEAIVNSYEGDSCISADGYRSAIRFGEPLAECIKSLEHDIEWFKEHAADTAARAERKLYQLKRDLNIE